MSFIKFKTHRERLIAIAFLLEGEGTFAIGSSGIRIKCMMTDKDVIYRLQRLAGCGNIYEQPVEFHKTVWCWQLATRFDVVSLCQQIRPFMGKRRRAKIDELLNWHDAHPLRSTLVAHGSVTMYNKRGCRCDICKQGRRDYNHQYYLAKIKEG